MHKAFKFRLKPTKEQEKVLINFGGASRWIWNYMLELNQEKYKNEKKFIFKNEQCKLITGLRKQHLWLKDIYCQSLQQVCIDLDLALTNSFSKKANRKGFPKFKQKVSNEDSFRIPQQNGQIKITKNRIKIPKIGWINWIRHREIEGVIKSITISKDIDQWYVSCLCEIDHVPETLPVLRETSLGIDLGIKEFAVASDSKIISNNHFLKNSEKKLVKKQKQLSRKQFKSKNRNKARIAVAKIHRKIRNQRKDFKAL